MRVISLKTVFFFASIILFFELKSQLQFNLIPYRKGKLWGFCDSTGKVKISPRYEEVEFFHRVDDFTQRPAKLVAGLARAKLNGRFGVIDTLGNVFLDFKYSGVGVGSTIKVKDGKCWLAYNVLSRTFESWKSCDDNPDPGMVVEHVKAYYPEYKLVKEDEGQFRITKQEPAFWQGQYEPGDITSILVYADSVHPLKAANIKKGELSIDSIFVIWREGKLGFATVDSKEITACIYDSVLTADIQWSGSSRTIVVRQNGQWMSIFPFRSVQSNPVEPIVLGSDISLYSKYVGSPLWKVENGKRGLITVMGKTLIPTIYDSVVDMKSGHGKYFALRKEKKWAITKVSTETKEQKVSQFDFDDITPGTKYAFSVRKGNLWYILLDDLTTVVYPEKNVANKYLVYPYVKLIEVRSAQDKLIGYASYNGLKYWKE